MAKTHNKKKDFIKILTLMNDNQLNDYIKRYGIGPKPVQMCHIVDNSIPYEELSTVQRMTPKEM